MSKESLSNTVKNDSDGTCVDPLTNKKVECQELEIQGTIYKTLLNTKYLNRKKWELPNEKHILSYIPGTILEVHVKDGDKVEQDQPLLMLEAMKMENIIFAPFAGTLKKVSVSVGDRIPKGVIMVEFE